MALFLSSDRPLPLLLPVVRPASSTLTTAASIWSTSAKSGATNDEKNREQTGIDWSADTRIGMQGAKHVLSQPSAIVTDLFKCIVHVDFAEERLYRFVRDEGLAVMRKLWSGGEWQQHVRAARRIAHKKKLDPEFLIADESAPPDQQMRSLHKHLVWHLDQAQGETEVLFAIKHLMYAHAYQSGQLQTVVYADAVRCLKHWKEQGIPLILFSDTSHQHQQLFLSKTNAGDLRPLFKQMLDYGTVAASAYTGFSVTVVRKLCHTIGEHMHDVMYVSGSEESVGVAAAAGANAFLVVSDRRAQFPAMRAQYVLTLNRVRVFDDILFQQASQQSDSPTNSTSTDDNKSSDKKSAQTVAQTSVKQPAPAKHGK